MILIIDNYDSFVFNIARYFEVLGAQTMVTRNDAISLEAIAAAPPRAIVLSPGPCSPQEAGLSTELVRRFSGRLPLLGVCLGHQCIGAAFGARVARARRPMHGQASAISHCGQGIFDGLPSPMAGARYHSLIVEPDNISPLEVTARSEDGEVMGLAHRDHPTFGLQFHPESILTTHGRDLIRAFLDRAA